MVRMLNHVNKIKSLGLNPALFIAITTPMGSLTSEAYLSYDDKPQNENIVFSIIYRSAL